jgi:hypothetical protein
MSLVTLAVTYVIVVKAAVVGLLPEMVSEDVSSSSLAFFLASSASRPPTEFPSPSGADGFPCSASVLASILGPIYQSLCCNQHHELQFQNCCLSLSYNSKLLFEFELQFKTAV